MLKFVWFLLVLIAGLVIAYPLVFGLLLLLVSLLIIMLVAGLATFVALAPISIAIQAWKGTVGKE